MGGDWQTDRERSCSKAVAGRPGKVVAAEWVAPHLYADKPVGTTGERDRPATSRSSQKIPVEFEAAGETPSLTGEIVGEIPRVSHLGISTRRAQFACGFRGSGSMPVER